MVRIAIDVMGGDNAPAAPIDGAIEAMKLNPDIEVIFFGPQEQINQILSTRDYPDHRVAIINCTEIIHSEDQPAAAARRKQDASMIRAIKAVKAGAADAAVSAGNTGALMVGSILHIGRLPGVERPALSAIFPTLAGKGLTVLDVGANMDPTPEQLLVYSLMGRLFATWVMGIAAPRVGLLNVGTEANKGNSVIRAAYQLMQEKTAGFVGNVESRELLQGTVDVLVCDGFTGNVMLKAVEGVASGLFTAIKEEILAGGLKAKVGGALVLPALKGLKSRFDQEDYGGAPLLGIAAPVLKVHGSSTARGVRNALLNQAYPFVSQRLLEKISSEVAE